MFTKTQSGFIPQLLTALLAVSLLLSACTPAVNPTTQPNPTETSAPAATAVPPSDGSLPLSLDTGNMATSFQTETVAAVSANTGAPYWEVLPEYTRVTLRGYPITSHTIQPQIFIYPAGDLASANENAGKVLTDLQALLQTRQAGDQLPILPLINAAQAMQAQVQYLDFKNGNGVRFLTQFNQGLVPINNNELIYTYQGLTSDGKYYIAALLPVTNPDLPDTSEVSGKQAEGLVDYPGYISKLVTLLNQQPSGSFAPDLAEMDALVESLRIR